jgi:putative transposase
VVIIRGAPSPDHIQMLISVPAHRAPSKMVQFIKGRSSRRLQEEYPETAQKVLGAARVGARVSRRDGGRGR